MSDIHSRIIAAAAKAELAPIGFQQKGRSRLWFADHGSWLNVVEFTPSRWSKSVSLMNAAHWLWVGAGFMSFNEAVPSKCHAEFETEDQFRGAACEIARTARANAVAIEERFSSFGAIADFVVERAHSSLGRAAPLLPLIAHPDAFRSKVNEVVAQERARLKLAPLNHPAF